jgi:hypothetical protein
MYLLLFLASLAAPPTDYVVRVYIIAHSQPPVDNFKHSLTLHAAHMFADPKYIALLLPSNMVHGFTGCGDYRDSLVIHGRQRKASAPPGPIMILWLTSMPMIIIMADQVCDVNVFVMVKLVLMSS